MKDYPKALLAEKYILHLFSSRAAREGSVVRRKTRNIHRIVGRKAFLKEIKRRGYSAVENAGQTVIFCNREPLLHIIGEPKSLPRIWSRPYQRA
jgi:hypothetical protein